MLFVTPNIYQEHIKPQSSKGACNWEIATWPTGTKISSCLIWLFRYFPMCILTGFSNRYAVTLRATQLSQKQPLCIGGQRRGPLSVVFSMDMESRRAEHAAELYRRGATATRGNTQFRCCYYPWLLCFYHFTSLTQIVVGGVS